MRLGALVGAAGIDVTSRGSDLALDVVDLHMRFAGVKALDGLNLTLRNDEVVGVLGPNGSGKTTMVNCLSGILRPTAGLVAQHGREITRTSAARRAKGGLVRTYQNLRLFSDLTVAENVEVGLFAGVALSAAHRRERLRQTLESHDLIDVARSRAGELPYGTQKRVEIARALISRPAVLLLDEPAAGLGQDEAERLSAALSLARKEHRCSIILIDHNVPFVAALADRMVLLAGGKIVRDAAPNELLADPAVAEMYLGKAAGHA
jgi:branched-chain amino acid transport system ATP-binding protein